MSNQWLQMHADIWWLCCVIPTHLAGGTLVKALHRIAGNERMKWCKGKDHGIAVGVESRRRKVGTGVKSTNQHMQEQGHCILR